MMVTNKSNSHLESIIKLTRLSDLKYSNSYLEFVIRNNVLFSKSKRSQGHVEIIISFTLFVGVLVLLFIFINPLAKTGKEINVDKISKIIIDEISSEIGVISVIIDEGILEEDYCYDVSKFVDGRNVLEVQDSKNPRKFDIYFSDDLNNDNNYYDNCVEENYNLGVYTEEEMIVRKKIEDLKARYSDYSSLKNSLGIRDDFMFSLSKIDGSLISELSVSKDVPVGVDVYVKEFPIIVINSDGRFEELILNIKVW